jgi:hypothetical protein
MTISPPPLIKKEAPSLYPLKFSLSALYLAFLVPVVPKSLPRASLTAKVCFCRFVVAGCYATAFGGANALTKCAYKRFFRRCNLPSPSIRFCITSTAISCCLSPASRRFASPGSSSVPLASQYEHSAALSSRIAACSDTCSVACTLAFQETRNPWW